MKIKVYRRIKNKIELYICTNNKELEIFLNNGYVKNVKELIQVGDLFMCAETLREIGNKTHQGQVQLLSIRNYEITKILTPNEDKTQYTLQWEE